jgi:hypothetical protein
MEVGLKKLRFTGLLTAITISMVVLALTFPFSQVLATTLGTCGSGWLEKTTEGNLILHVKGTPYEMGFQHGALLPNEIKQDINALVNWAIRKGSTYDELLKIYNQLEPYIPQRYLDEMQGISDSAGVPLERVHVAHAIPTRYHCSGIVAFGSATSDGKLYHTRSLDFSLKIEDPNSGKRIQENAVIIAYQPNTGYPSVNITWAGFIGSVGGMNNQKICVGEMGSKSNDESYSGVPMIFRLRKVLDEAATLDEALEILRQAPGTCGYNFLVSDGKIPDARAVEMTANLFYAGAWDDPVEATKPHWQMTGLVRRTNHFVDPGLAKTERRIYNLSSFVFWIIGQNQAFPSWTLYEHLSRYIQARLGTLDATIINEAQRAVYRGDTSAKIAFAHIPTLHQWVATPATGDLLVSCAGRSTPAYEMPIYAYNLNEMLAAIPELGARKQRRQIPTPPTISITSPLNGEGVCRLINFQGIHSGNLEISNVKFSVDSGAYEPAQGTASWDYSLDTFIYSNDSDAIIARSVDSSDNDVTDSVSLDFSNRIVAARSNRALGWGPDRERCPDE